MVSRILVERRLINRSAAVHYTTILEQAESKWLSLRPPTFVIPNPVDLREFSELPPSGKFRTSRQLPPDGLIVLYLGRVEHRKGIDFAIRAFAQASRNIHNAYFVIAGPYEDNYEKTLEKEAQYLGIREKIIFTGYLNRLERLTALIDADIFILTSYSENFGMAIVEAMASGLPVIISDKVGIADDIRAAGAGRVVPLQVSLIANVLSELLSSEELRKNLGAIGRKYALETYTSTLASNLMSIQLDRIVRFPIK